MYLIQDKVMQQLFWSNSMGWVGVEDADVFTKEEMLMLNTPIGGKWLKLKEEKSVLTYHKLALIIDKMSESEKLCTVTIYKEDSDEYFPVQSIQPSEEFNDPILWVK